MLSDSGANERPVPSTPGPLPKNLDKDRADSRRSSRPGSRGPEKVAAPDGPKPIPFVGQNAGCNMAMGHSLWLDFGVDEHPFATCFDVHQGYRVLTHSQMLLQVGWIKYGLSTG